MKLNHSTHNNLTKIVWGSFVVAILIRLFVVVYQFSERLYFEAQPVGYVAITTDKSSYKLGEQVGYSIENHYQTSIVINTRCNTVALHIYRRDGNNWQPLLNPLSINKCASLAHKSSLAASASTKLQYLPVTQLFDQPGSYRLVVITNLNNKLIYKDFEVIE